MDLRECDAEKGAPAVCVDGFRIAMATLVSGRLSVAAGCLGVIEDCLTGTIDYAKERMAFGEPIINLQNTQFKLAEAKTEVTVARTFVDKLISLMLEDKLDAETAAMAKWWTSDLQNKVIDECLQLHGGYGYMWEFPIARAWADARVQRIYAGSNEIMKVIIGRGL